jgi:hypothetical protein
MVRKRNVLLKTLLIVGEGDCEKAFLSHMKSLFDGRTSGQTVKVISADGGCPYDIIDSAVRYRHAAFDRKFVLLDSDIPINSKAKKYAKKNKVELLFSTPFCLEGMLLTVLDEVIPHSSGLCKEKLHNMLSGTATKASSYEDLFSRDVLESTPIQQVEILRNLMRNT